MEETEKYAVRWPQRETKSIIYDDFCIYTKWHWTTNPDVTICGCRVVLGREGNLPLFPQTDELVERVDCRNCLRILEKESSKK